MNKNLKEIERTHKIAQTKSLYKDLFKLTQEAVEDKEIIKDSEIFNTLRREEIIKFLSDDEIVILCKMTKYNKDIAGLLTNITMWEFMKSIIIYKKEVI